MPSIYQCFVCDDDSQEHIYRGRGTDIGILVFLQIFTCFSVYYLLLMSTTSSNFSSVWVKVIMS